MKPACCPVKEARREAGKSRSLSDSGPKERKKNKTKLRYRHSLGRFRKTANGSGGVVAVWVWGVQCQITLMRADFLEAFMSKVRNIIIQGQLQDNNKSLGMK